MNMVRSLSAMEERIIVAKNAIAIIVVYFYLLVLLFFLTAKIGPILVPCKFFPHFLHQIWRHLPRIATSTGSTLYSCRVVLTFFLFLLHPSVFGFGIRRSAIIAGRRASSNSSDVPKDNRANPHDT